MRRLIALLVAVVVAASIPATVSAAKPTRFTEQSVGIVCDGIAPTTGTGFLFLQVAIFDGSEAQADVVMWNVAEPNGPPDVSSDFGTPADASYVGGAFTATIPLFDLDGDPVADGTVNATLTPVGDAQTFEDNSKEGNVNVRTTLVVQPLAAVGTAVIGGKTFSLDACFASDETFTEWSTNPTAFTDMDRFGDARCDLTNSAGDTAFLFMDISRNDVFVDVVLFEDEADVLGAFGDVPLSRGTGSGQLELYDPETGEPVAGHGTIDLALANGDGWSYALRASTGRLSVRGRLVDIEGQLTLPGAGPFDLGDCVGFVGREKEIIRAPHGPKPSAKRPANDLPSGARLLAVGAKTTQSTRGASPDREASYSCLTFDEEEGPFEVPVANTVWFKVRGTGTDVTVSSAGSSFDTVAAAYVRDGAGGFDEVACVDDVELQPFGESLQAAVTFPTMVGTTYYIQIGGFPDFLPYGNLRVRVR